MRKINLQSGSKDFEIWQNNMARIRKGALAFRVSKEHYIWLSMFRTLVIELARDPLNSKNKLACEMLQSTGECPYGDRHCPCPDGLACHYVDVGSSKAWPAP